MAMPRLAPAMVSWLKTRVHMDKIVVSAVMRMGRIRVLPVMSSASRFSKPAMRS